MSNPFESLIDEQDAQAGGSSQPQNPFVDLLEQQERQETTVLKASATLAAGVSPDRAAEARRIAARTGQPVELVERNFEEFTRRDKITSTPFADIMRQTPALAESLKEPNTAAIMQDDLENLGFLEWLTTAPQRAFSRGMNQLEVARLRTKQMSQPLTQDEQDRLASAKYHMQRDSNLGLEGGGQWWARGPIAGLASQLPNLFGAGMAGAEKSAWTIPAAFAAGAGAAAALGTAPLSVPVLFGAGLTAGMMTGGAEFSFEIEAGLAYDEFLDMKDELDQPMDPETARMAAIGAGALNAGLEVVGLGILVKTIPGIDKLTGDIARSAIKEALRAPTVRQALAEAGKTYVTTLGKETAVEVAQRFFTIAGGELAKFASGQDFKHLGAGEWASDLTHEALQAVQTFSLLAAPGPALSLTADVRRAKQAQQNEGFFNALSQGATNSKTIQRQPQAAQDFIARATKDGPIENVYAPVEAWTTYWQSKGVDPAEMATELTGNPKAYSEAKATGIDITIPTAAYAVKLAGTEHNAALWQELRLQPDAMNARESKEFIAEQEAAAAEAAPAPQADQVRAEMLQRLQVALAGSGIKLPPGAVERYAESYEALFGRLGERAGVDPVELFQRYGVEVLGPGEQGGPTAPGGPGGAPVTPTPEVRPPSVDDLDRAVAVASGVPSIGVDEVARAELAEIRRKDVEAFSAQRGTPGDVPTTEVGQRLEAGREAPATAEELAAIERESVPIVKDWKRPGKQRAVDAPAGAAPATEPVVDTGDRRRESDVAATAQQLLDTEFPPGSPEREEIIELRKAADPDDFKTFLQDVFTPRPAAELFGLHPVGSSGDAFAWGLYLASLREVKERYPSRAVSNEEFLEWDTPASRQSLQVQQALRALGIRWTRGNDPTGGELYRSLSQATQHDPTGTVHASHVLQQHGVLGVRYVDTGADNYIAFDESGAPLMLWQSERPAGFDAIAQHLTPAERDKLKRDHAERLVAIFKELPADRDFSDVALAGIAKRGWYRESAAAIRAIFGNVDGPRFAALLAAMSPQTSVESNLYNAVSTWRNWTKAGRPTTRAGILKVMARSVQGTKGVDSVLASWVPNTVRALAADEPMSAVLSGPKVHSFYRNLLGEMNEVTNDAWMSSFALVDKGILGGGINKAGTDPGKGPGYLAMIAKIRRVAQKLTEKTGETWHPAEVQETIWSWAKTLYELAEAEGTDAETIVREGRLSDQAIASTPDFKTLFTTDPTVRSILEAAGYGEAISALETELGRPADRGVERPGAVDVGPRAEGRQATLGELRSARRLDELRRQRQEATRLKEGTELRQELRPAFYSRILQAVADAKTNKATGAQWKATIRNSKAGINLEEFALTDVDELEDGRSYTRDEVADYLRAHRVEVSQVIHGDPDGEGFSRGPSQEAIEERAQEIYDEREREARDAAFDNFESDLRFNIEAEEITQDDPDNPDEEITTDVWRVRVYGTMQRSGRRLLEEHDEVFLSEEEAQDWLDSETGQEWRDKHEDDERETWMENYESDVSFADAVDEATDELGSGTDIEAEETFYGTYVLDKAEPHSYREAFVTAEVNIAEKSWQDGHEDFSHVNNPIVRIRFNARTGYSVDQVTEYNERQLVLPEVPAPRFVTDIDRREAELEDLGVPKKRILFLEEVQAPTKKEFENMPSLFQKNWRDIGFKWALRYAAEHNFDVVAWTTGKQQADRYSLRQKVSKISWAPVVGMTDQLITIETMESGTIRVQVNNEGIVQHTINVASQWTGEHLSEVVGKDIADEIIAKHVGTIEGEGLEIGGRGLTRLYDVDFPNVVKNLPVVKKTKGKVSKFTIGRPVGEFTVDELNAWIATSAFAIIARSPHTNMPHAVTRFSNYTQALLWISEQDKRDDPIYTEKDIQANPGGAGANWEIPVWRVIDPSGGVVRVFESLTQAEKLAEERTAALREGAPVNLQPGIEITPDMRTAILGGQALFQPLRAGQALESPGRGNIFFGPNRQFTIKLFQDADVSTFMHESAHLFLEVLQDLATQPTASEGLKVDLQILRSELWGIAPDAAIGVREHEMFARAFERYLMEGKAPSVGLRGLFNSFRAWLLKLYRTIAELDVPLTDDVRSVFDRMLASDRAIEEARAEFTVTPMFTTPESAGMTPEEFGRYQATIEDASRKARETLEAKLLLEVRRAQTTAWRTQADDTRREVAAEVHAQPVYQALAAIRSGTRPDGSPIVEGATSEPLRLSRAIIVERYGEDRLRTLPRPYVYSAQGGLDPDVVGQMFGFTSGDALLQAISSAPPMSRAIEEQVDQRMRERYGDMVLEDRVPEEAKAALANEFRDEIIRKELRALGELRRIAAPFVQAGQQDLAAERRERAYERRWFEAEAKLRIAIAEGRKAVEIEELRNEVLNLRRRARGGAATVRAGIPSDNVLREAARQRIGRTKIRDIRPATFWSAARRASTEATEAAATQDFDGAIVAKQNELINLALYRQATFAKEQAEKRTRQMQRFSTPAARAQLGLAGEDYVDQVDAILDRYDFARATQKVLDRRQALRQWVAGLEAQHLPVQIPEAVLDDARRIHYRELTFDELVAVTDGVNQIAHLARLKVGLMKKARARTLQAAVEEIASSIRAKARRTEKRLWGSRLPANDAQRLIDAGFAAHRKMHSLARELDGFEDGGPMWEYVILPLNKAADTKAVRTAAATRALHDIVNAAYVGREKVKLYDKLHLPEIGASLTKMERLMVALNWGNEGNRQRLMRGHGINDAQVQAILDTLDQRDWSFVQAVWDHIDSYWQEIADKERRVTGLAPEKVDATPVKTKFGEMRGGYFPVKWDGRISGAAQKLLDLERAKLEVAGAYVSSTTRRGHVEERRDQVGAEFKLRLDFGVIFEHVNQVIHDLTHHETLIDVNRILGNAQVRDAIYDTMGDIIYDQFKNGVKAVASGDVIATEAHEKITNHIRVGTTVALLGWSLSVPLLQPIGLTQSVTRIGGKWVARGMGRWLRDAASMENTVAWISAKSDFMRMRGQTQQREINEIRNTIGLNTGKVQGWVEEILNTVTLDKVTQAGMADSFFFLIQQAQRIADVPTWLGQYEKSMAAGETEPRAIELADQAVIDSQGSGYIKDLAAVQRGPAAWKLWTNFYSFFSTTYNNTAEATARSRYNQPGAIGRLAADYMLLFIIPATLSYFVREGMRAGDDDDDKNLLAELAQANLSYLMGTMMGLRELSGAVQGYYGYEGPAGAALFARASRLIRQVQQGEADAALWRALNDTAGILFHYPSGQIRRTIEGIVALIEGRTTNPGALVSGPPAE